MANPDSTEKEVFPPVSPGLSTTPNPSSAQSPAPQESPKRTRPRATSSISTRARAASLKFIESNPPSGFMAATGEAAGKAPSLGDIRRSSIGSRSGRRESLPGGDPARNRATSSGSRQTAGSATSPVLYSHTIPEIEFQNDPLTPPVAVATDGSKRRTRDFADILDDDDFASQMLGRGKLEGQSFVRGGKENVADATPKEPNGGDDEDGDNDSLLAELGPKPKRRSKNLEAIFGEDTKRTSAADTSMAPGGSKRNTRDFADMIESGEYEPGRGKFDKQAFDLSASKRASRASALPAADGPIANKAQPRPSDENSTALAVPTISHSTGPLNPSPHAGPNEDGYYPNGYKFPEKRTWKEATIIGTKATFRFPFSSILNFLITIYGLNVVAWGGMLFLLLCNASPAMCHLADGRYDCNDIDSPRRIWIEIDSQILNALFCVTGFGLVPWRFRDWWFLLQFRVLGKYDGLRRLAGVHSGWFRLPGSENLAVKGDAEEPVPIDENSEAVPIPAKNIPDEPLTGVRAPPTKLWKMDYVIYAFVANTFLQAVLSGFMWGLNRYDRPSWSTGLFVALACIVAALGGLMQFMESKRIKKIEGVPVPDENGDTNKGSDSEEKGAEPVIKERESLEKRILKAASYIG